jgi:hypothetical protein
MNFCRAMVDAARRRIPPLGGGVKALVVAVGGERVDEKPLVLC